MNGLNLDGSECNLRQKDGESSLNSSNCDVQNVDDKINLVVKSKVTGYGNELVQNDSCTDTFDTQVRKESPSIAIIGSGISGLSAAHHLHENGFKKVIILEASNRAGGRIYTHTIKDGSVKLELGAQWIHGQEGNPLFELALKHDLITTDSSNCDDEKAGIYCTDDGNVINEQLVEIAISKLDQIKEEISTGTVGTKSVGEYFEQQFQLFINNDVHNQELDDGHKIILWSLFKWYMTFECIDNACRDLKNVSSHGYKEWHDCPGRSLVNFKSGYDSIVQTILNEIPKDWLKYDHQVTKIDLFNQDKQQFVVVTINNGQQFMFDHVIITISLGCLKEAIKNGGMLSSLVSKDEQDGCPLISIEKQKVINSLGYGTINKIFLIFDFDYWPDDFAVKFVWRQSTEQQLTKSHEQFPDWIYDISGFDRVRGRKDILLGWIGGHGSEVIETVQSEEVGTICVKLLRKFLPSMSIEEPKEVIVTKWFTNPFFCGSYSHRTVEFVDDEVDGKVSNLEILQEPVCDENSVARILFAGEATDREFYSSTHGALRSGIREADRLISQLIN